MHGRERLEQALRQRRAAPAPVGAVPRRVELSATGIPAKLQPPPAAPRDPRIPDPRIPDPRPPVSDAQRAAPAKPPNPASLAASRASPRTAKRSSWAPAGWTALGFTAGVVFWHFVGFWGFVSDVVFKADPSGAPIAATAREGGPAADRRKLQTTVYGGIPPADLSNTTGCTLLRLDRNTGRTSTAFCEDGLPAMAAAPGSRRWPPRNAVPAAAPAPAPPRRAPSVAGWSTSVQQLSEADPDEQSTTSAAAPQ